VLSMYVLKVNVSQSYCNFKFCAQGRSFYESSERKCFRTLSKFIVEHTDASLSLAHQLFDEDQNNTNTAKVSS